VTVAASEDRESFLQRFSDSMQSLTDPVAVQHRAAWLLGEYLDVHRTSAAEVYGDEPHVRASHVRGLPPLPRRFDYGLFAPRLRESHTCGDIVAVENVSTDTRLRAEDRATLMGAGVAAFADVMLLKEGTRVAAFSVQHAVPRTWSAEELSLIRQVVERTWSSVRRARAETALRENEERMRLILDSIHDYAIISTDRGGLVTSWNQGAERTFGYPQREALGRHIGFIFTREDRDHSVPQDEMLRAAERGRAEDDRWHLHKSGIRLFVSGVLSPLRIDGAITGYVKVARDVTRRKHLDEARQHEHGELEVRVRQRTDELADLAIALRQELGEREAAELRIKNLFTQVVSVQEEERRRIAREVHDQLGQQVTALRMTLETFTSQCDPATPLGAQAVRTGRLAQELDDSIDFVIQDLRPSALDHLGLSAALDTLVRGWSDRFGIAAEYHARGLGDVRFPPHVEINIYRIVQEALHNVVKHARATSVAVVLEQMDGELKVAVEDDGRGFNVEDVAVGTPVGLGLLNMGERASLIGGEMDIESSAGTGTTVYVRVPAVAAS
jgi:PAS domain S-box-containing protein